MGWFKVPNVTALRKQMGDILFIVVRFVYSRPVQFTMLRPAHDI